MIAVKDVVFVPLNPQNLNTAIDNAQIILDSIIDRGNLHSRDKLEQFNNILMGEIAEQMVMQWLSDNGKFVQSSVDKNSGVADLGHDLYLKNRKNNEIITCSIKSSLSYSKGLDGILQYFKLATTPTELRSVNIQVYFWLDLNPQIGSRTTVTSFKHSAIIGWFGYNDLIEFDSYNREKRLAPVQTLQNARTMQELLDYLA